MKKWALALCLVLLSSNFSNAQTVSVNSTSGQVDTAGTVASSGNVLNLGGGLPWDNTVTGQAGGLSGGWTPAYNPNTGNIIFGYNNQTVSQTVAINQALSKAGTGIQLSGYSYSWGINNDLNNGSGNRGTLTGNVSLNNPNGYSLESYNYNYSGVNTGGNFQTFSGTQMFSNQYQLSQVSSITVSFTGHDQNWWAGYWGPRVHVNDFSLLYSVNPCTTNPAYSPSCSGFSKIVTSDNLLPNPNLVVSGNDVGYNSFAVNTALKNSGSGVDVYGFNYGYNYSLGNSCNTTNQGGLCTNNSSAQVKVRLTDSSNNQIYIAGQSWSTPNTAANTSYQFLLASTTNSLSLGTFTMGALTTGNAAVQNMFVNALYKPDPCLNPLSSPNCPGYASAYAQQLALNSISNSSNSTVNNNANTAQAVANQAQQAAQPQQSDPSQPAQQQTAAAPPPGSAPPPQQQQSDPGQPAQQTAGAPPPQSQPAPQQQQQQQAQNSGQQQAQPAGQVQVVQTSDPKANLPAAPQQAANQPGAPSAGTQPVAQAGQPQQSAPKAGGPSNLSTALSTIAKNQEQQKQIETTTVQASIAQANQASATAQQTALNVVSAVNNSVAASSAQSVSTANAVATTSVASGSSSTSSYNSNSQMSIQTGVTSSTQSVLSASQALASSSSTRTSTTNQNNIVSTNVTQTTQTTSVFAPTTTQVTSTSNATNTNTNIQASNPVANVQQTQTVATSTSTLPTNNTPTVQNSLQQNQNAGAVAIQTPQQQSTMVASVQQSSLYSLTPNTTFGTTVETINNNNVNLLSRTSPIAEAINKAPTIDTNTKTETANNQPAVNQKVEQNELAGKVELAKMAIAPTNYGSYLNFTLKDAAFYAPKEIYRNQSTVDNSRALRKLSSDSLFEKMVELQYKESKQ